VLRSSNVSNSGSDPDEQVEVPGSADGDVDYIAKVSLANAGATNITGQHYSISLVTFDNSQCLASEPTGGDDTFNTGRCVGTFTPDAARPCDESARAAEPLTPGGLAACTTAPNGTAGCGRLCANTDVDYYRLGTLNNEQVVHASLDYDTSQGALALSLERLTSTGVPQQMQTQSDTNGDGHIDLTFTASTVPPTSAREHAIKVRPSGATGHQAELYSLSIDVGDPCFDDQNDAGDSNETPANSTLIRPNPTFNAPFTFDSSSSFTPASSRCSNDVDVYELFSFSGEDVTVTLTGPPGLLADVGTRPDDLDDPAESVGTATANGAPFVFSNPVSQQLYVTIKPTAGQVVTGLYTLTVSTTP
jgi:hypothetical protein